MTMPLRSAFFACLAITCFIGVNLSSPAHGSDENAGKQALTEQLMQSAEECNPVLLKTLLSRGADVNARDEEGRTALMLASVADTDQLAEVLLYDQIDDGPATVVMIEAKAEEIERARMAVIELLLAKGADLDLADNGGITALHYSLAGSQPHIAAYLINKGAKTDTASKDGVTPLISAASPDCKDIFYMLVDKGADIKATTKDGSTVLMFAIEEGNDDMVKYLVKQGLDVNAANEQGRTPLMFAAVANAAKLAKYLISAGANPALKDSEGKTARDLALEHSSDSAANILNHSYVPPTGRKANSSVSPKSGD